MSSIVFLQPPSPPGLDVTRDYAGGFGVAARNERPGYGHGEFAIPCYPLMYSAAVLREEGFDVAFLDSQVERMDDETTIAAVRRLEPDIIVSIVNLPSIYGDGLLLKRLKEQCDGARLVCVGTVCRVIPEDVARIGVADAIVLGEPELVLPDLVRSLLDGSDINSVRGIGTAQDGRFTATPPHPGLVDPGELPWPPYGIMPTDRYRDPHFGANVRFFPVWSSRGCPMPCSFYCPYPVGLGRTTRIRPCEDVVREIAHLNREFGITAFTFRDQLFSFNNDNATEICDLVIEQKLRIRWICETRLDMISEGLLRKMRAAGCRKISFGLETGDPDHLYKVGKPNTKISTVKNAIKATKRAGIRPRTHIILGLPGESRASIQNTLSLLRELEITEVTVNLATPYPGTPLFRYAKEHGLLETEDWSRFTSFEGVMRTESMTISELEETKELFRKEMLAIRGPEFSLRRIKYLSNSGLIVEALADGLTSIIKKPSQLPALLRNMAEQRALLRKDS